MLTFGPEVTRTVAAEHRERLRLAASEPPPRGLGRRLGSLLVAVGTRLDPDARPARGASPCTGSHLALELDLEPYQQDAVRA